ncbi:MAG: phosphoglycerate dehydrogenase [Aeromicrobium sp.]
MRVLVAENIGASGIDLLRSAGFDVDLGTDWSRDELEKRVSDYDGLLIRSATKVDASLLAKATSLKAIGRAGVGVDNVDVDVATRMGIIVANAPQSNVVTAAEHTLALLLALARHVPQAHASLTGGAWERGKFTGVELHGKVLGILGFGRIGQLVAHRAKGFGMRVVAFDPYLAEERFNELGVERAATPADIYAVADFITIHLPKTPETVGFLNTAAFAQMKDGVRVLNVARGPLLVDEDLAAALESGKVAGAALDVFQTEPITEHPLFGHPKVVVTPHLGASTAEATDRAGYQAAEQVVAALTGGAVTTAVNIPAIEADDLAAVEPFLALSATLGRIAVSLAPTSALDGLEVEFLGHVAERDTRLLTIQVVKGALAGRTDESVNDVNALPFAAERGIAITSTSRPVARDFTDLVRVTATAEGTRTRVVGTVLGQQHRPHLLEAWGARFNVQLESHLAVFRYRDQPGMLGRLGTALGDAGINVVSAAVGVETEAGDEAVLLVTTDRAVPPDVLDAALTTADFHEARAVSL